MKYLLVLIILLSACSQKEYKNQANYLIKKGETVEIYYRTTSCCFYCVSNQNNLRHVEIVGEKEIDPGPTNSDGGTVTEAFVLKGVSVGTDTVFLKHVEASESCETGDTLKLEKYIINIE